MFAVGNNFVLKPSSSMRLTPCSRIHGKIAARPEQGAIMAMTSPGQSGAGTTTGDLWEFILKLNTAFKVSNKLSLERQSKRFMMTTHYVNKIFERNLLFPSCQCYCVAHNHSLSHHVTTRSLNTIT
eukprot:m.46588 g.46588  ORF g.46588 m.46588 type:complete len:126 (-) comp10387_c0_seq4:41-418(-)